MKKMRQKIAILLFALCATATVNAQTGPMKASQMGNATSVDELVGWFYWYNRTTTSTLPTTNGNTANQSLYPSGTSNNRYVAFTKINADSILIYNMFELPVKAKVVLNVSGKTPLAEADYTGYIDIPTGQVVQKVKSTNVLNGEYKLTQSTWIVTDEETGAGRWVAYSTVRMYLNAQSWFVDNNWIRMNYVYTGGTGTNEQYNGKTYLTGTNYIPGYNYSYSRVASAYADWNAVMYVEFDKSIQNYANTTYPVNITQEGNTVKVQNFNGGTTTVNIDLRADNSIDIAPNQTGTFGSTEYTYYPSPEGELGYTEDTEITGTGTEDELTWGSYSRRIASSKAGYQYSSGKIIFLNKDVDKFHFPVALTMTDAGWASFSSDKALDFSTVTALKPYFVTAVDESNGATLSDVVDPVAPHTGLFIEGAAGDYEIPTVIEGSMPLANELVATSEGEHTSDGQTYWGLGLDANSGQVGLKKMSAGTVAANKAYLIFNRTAAGAKSFLPFNFGGTTAIEGSLTPNPSPEGKGSLYNLQGQRVGEGYRGIVIKNGKKVVKH